MRMNLYSCLVAVTEKGEQLRAYANYLVQTLPRWIQEARVSQLDELEVHHLL